jgi:hypothetical protein
VTDQDIQNVYKSNLGTSEPAALRAVFDAGWYEALGQANSVGLVDASLAAPAPAAVISVVTL